MPEKEGLDYVIKMLDQQVQAEDWDDMFCGPRLMAVEAHVLQEFPPRTAITVLDALGRSIDGEPVPFLKRATLALLCAAKDKKFPHRPATQGFVFVVEGWWVKLPPNSSRDVQEAYLLESEDGTIRKHPDALEVRSVTYMGLDGSWAANMRIRPGSKNYDEIWDDMLSVPITSEDVNPDINNLHIDGAILEALRDFVVAYALANEIAGEDE